MVNFVLIALALCLPLALGQWYQSWKVAWLTLAFEVIYSTVALSIVAGWALFHLPPPR